MSTELIPHPEFTQTSLSKYFEREKTKGEEVIDISLRKLFEPTKRDVITSLSEKEKNLLKRPFFDPQTWEDYKEYSNEQLPHLSLVEQLEYEKMTDMLSQAIERCDHEYYEDSPIANMPEFYRRDLHFIDHKLLINSRYMDAYAFKSDLKKYKGKVLRAFVDGNRDDLWYYAQKNGYEVVNRRIDIYNAKFWVNVGGYQYPRKLLYRFKRGKSVEAFQIQGNGRKIPVLCVPVYGGVLLVQGRERPYYKPKNTGKVAAA